MTGLIHTMDIKKKMGKRLKNREFKEHILEDRTKVSFSEKEDFYFDDYSRFLKTKNCFYILNLK